MTRAATHRILHLSDLHLTSSGRDEDGVDSHAALARILIDCGDIAALDAIVVSGDIADDGSLAGYQDALAQVGAFAAARGIPQVYCTGNHDDRVNFASVLGSGHVGADGTDVGTLSTNAGCRAAVSIINGLRIITLDSLVPGATHGWLDDGQLAWLTDLLRTPAAAGSLVVLHHPPISPQPTTHMVLQNPERLATALTGGDVHAVLCGHLHHQVSGMLGAVPVWVTPGVVTRVDLTSPDHLVRAVLGASATVIDLDTQSGLMFQLLHARDPSAGQHVYTWDLVAEAMVPN